MVNICTICGAMKIPQDVNRSFHRFPQSEDLRERWFAALGKRATSRGAVVCSDHFIDKDFYDILSGFAIRRRRLLPNAVPQPYFKIRDHEYVIHTKKEKSRFERLESPETPIIPTANQEQSSSISEFSIAMDCVSEPSMTMDYSTANTPSPDVEKMLIVHNRDRKTEQVMHIKNEPKSCRFYIGKKLARLSRSDFTTEEGWNTFLSFLRQTRKEKDYLRKKTKRHKMNMSIKVKDIEELT